MKWGAGLLLLIACWSQAGQPSPLTALGDAWRTALAQPGTSASFDRFPFRRCFRTAALRYGLNESLLLAVARGESDFSATAISKANAIGVMQIQWPQTAKHLGIYRRASLYRPCDNIDAGARYLRQLLARYQGQTHLALAAYNYGPGRIGPTDTTIPDGALWYGRYILQHHDYIVGRRRHATATADDYRQEGQLELIRFKRPYRADAYVALLQQQLPDLQLSWFRQPDFTYKVVASYQGDGARQRVIEQLRSAGYRLAR